MAKSQKYYVVWHGMNPGIYHSWAECLAQVKAFPNAKYKAFSSLSSAKEAFQSNYESNIERKTNTQENWKLKVPNGSIAVDAACSGNPGDMEYRGVDAYTKSEIFRIGPLQEGTNNIGEFLAIVHALALLQKRNDSNTIIYSDSKIAINWVKLKHPNTKLKFTNKNKSIQDLIERAVQWLKTNVYKNPIKKWETELWGENPADFGRK
jgi:ribonuclease HI